MAIASKRNLSVSQEQREELEGVLQNGTAADFRDKFHALYKTESSEKGERVTITTPKGRKIVVTTQHSLTEAESGKCLRNILLDTEKPVTLDKYEVQVDGNIAKMSVRASGRAGAVMFALDQDNPDSLFDGTPAA